MKRLLVIGITFVPTAVLFVLLSILDISGSNIKSVLSAPPDIRNSFKDSNYISVTASVGVSYYLDSMMLE
jgi:hypothetical protein